MRVIHHLKQNGHWYIITLAMIAALLFYYWLQWADLTRFSAAFDHSPVFMPDFLHYYHPMGMQILQSPQRVSGYLYSLFFAILLAPLGLLPSDSAMLLWFGVEIAFLALMVVSASHMLQLSPPGMIFLLFLSLTEFPILHNVKWGQASILVTACIVAAFSLHRSNKNIPAGILLAFAAAIKYYPALAAVYFIIKRDLRAFFAFLAAFVFFYFILPASLFGFSQWLVFEESILRFARDGLLTYDMSSQFIADVGFRWHMMIFDSEPAYELLQSLVVLGWGIGLFCIVLAWQIIRGQFVDEHSLAMTALLLAVPFLIRTSWPHYFVYLPVCQAVMLSHFAGKFRTSGLAEKLLILLPLASIVFSSVFFFLRFRNWVYYSGYGVLFFANLFLLISLYAAVTVHPKLIQNRTHY